MNAHFAKAQINGIDLYYRRLGTGLPLLLLHGGLANADYWDNQLPVFAETYKDGYTCPASIRSGVKR